MAELALPVVDLRDARSADASARERFVQTLGHALETWGFVAVTGHGVPPDLLDATYAEAAAFFARPAVEKAQWEFPSTGRQRGYTGFGIEHARDTAVADLKEFWQLGRDLGVEHPLHADGTLLRNVVPDTAEAFHRRTTALFAALDAFAMDLLDAIARYLGLDADTLVDATRVGNSVLRVIHYPPLRHDAPPGAVRSAAHEDINLLTVLPASTQPGLELLDKESGAWLSITTPPNVMICDTGDIMARLTAGRLKSTTHRVVNPASAANVARYSMPYFCHPRPDFVIDPGDGTVPGLTAGAFLRERLIANGVLEG
jgi:isopenicillin N synthase-like dioxygenase